MVGMHRVRQIRASAQLAAMLTLRAGSMAACSWLARFPLPVRVSLAAGTCADGGCTGRVAAKNKRGLQAGPLGTVTSVATVTGLRTPVRVP
jgi:hypothetical protein